MNWTTVKNISVLVGVASGLVAVMAFVISLLSASELRQQTAKEEWKSVVIYQTVRDSGSDGIGFNDVFRRYSDLAESYGLEKGDLSATALNKILLKLTQSHVIVHHPNGNFVVMRLAPQPWPLPGGDTVANSGKFEEAFSRILAQEPGRYTAEQLTDKIESETKVPRTFIRSAIAFKISTGQAVANPDNTLRFRWQ